MTYPLDEVDDVTPLETFYSRNPEELTDEELEALVTMHRNEREDRLMPKVRKATVRSKPSTSAKPRTKATPPPKAADLLAEMVARGKMQGKKDEAS